MSDSKKSDWEQFLAQRQKRKQLIKEKEEFRKKNLHKIASPNHPHITSRTLQKSSSIHSTSNVIQNDDDDDDDDDDMMDIDHNGKWSDLYEDVIYHISSFCTLLELLNISLCCRIWNKYVSYLDENKWRLWYNAINYEMKSISSLDRTGKSNHFIITQNAYDSYDSVYHFAKFGRFSKYVLSFNDYTKISRNQLFDSLININNHSISVIKLFVDRLQRNIIYEQKENNDEQQDKDKDNENSQNGSLSLANPELIYINNSYDTASDTETSMISNEETDFYDDDEHHIIIIDDNEYNRNDKDIILIRNNMKYIVKIYKYLKFCIKKYDYLKLLYLFQNIICIESRPILRWFLFMMDRSECFGKKEVLLNNKNIGDITIFLKYLENYIREIHAIININKQNEKLKTKYLCNHQQYLLQMCVDIDEVRARGKSSLQYWLKSGTMVCNPDL